MKIPDIFWIRHNCASCYRKDIRRGITNSSKVQHFKRDCCWKQAEFTKKRIWSAKHPAGLSYLPSDMAGIILSHEAEVSPCGLHRVATPRRWPGQRHRWLIRWEAHINKTTHTHLLQTVTLLLLKCKFKAVFLNQKQTPEEEETLEHGASPRSRSTCEARLLLKVTVMAALPHSTTGCSFCQICEGPGVWPLALSSPYTHKHGIWLHCCGTSWEMQRRHISQQTLMWHIQKIHILNPNEEY